MADTLPLLDTFLWLTGAGFWLWTAFRLARFCYGLPSALAWALWRRHRTSARRQKPYGARYARDRAAPRRGTWDAPGPYDGTEERGHWENSASGPLRRAAAGSASLGHEWPDESAPSDEPALRSQGAQVLPLRTRGGPHERAEAPVRRNFARRGRGRRFANSFYSSQVNFAGFMPALRPRET